MSQIQKKKFYIPSSVQEAPQILQYGCKVSTSGKLGAGIYVYREEKAKMYAQGAIIKVIISYRKPKFQSTYYGWNDDRWLKNGHDACRIDLEDEPEWVVKDPSQIQVLQWYKL